MGISGNIKISWRMSFWETLLAGGGNAALDLFPLLYIELYMIP